MTGHVGWLLYNFALNLIGFRQLIRRIASRHYKGVGARVDALVRLGLEQAVSILICTTSPLLWLRYSSHLTLCTGSEVVHSTVAERPKGLGQSKDRRSVDSEVAIQNGNIVMIIGHNSIGIFAIRETTEGSGISACGSPSLFTTGITTTVLLPNHKHRGT
jgi:hypothetical protein